MNYNTLKKVILLCILSPPTPAGGITLAGPLGEQQFLGRSLAVSPLAQDTLGGWGLRAPLGSGVMPQCVQVEHRSGSGTELFFSCDLQGNPERQASLSTLFSLS